MIKYLYYLIISLLLVFIYQNVFANLGVLNNLNLILAVLVFVTIVWGFNLGFIFSLFLGFLLNLYSFLPFGTFIIIYLLIVTVINFLYKYVFINFSLLTNLILITFASCLYSLLFVAFNSLFFLIGWLNYYIILDSIFFWDLLWQVILNAILISVIYIFARTFSKRLNSVFLIKK